MREFVSPANVSIENFRYNGYRSYAEYNYLKPGFASKIKLWHFNMALELTAHIPQNATVIDFGCCDGAFIPTLSKYFRHVIAVDTDETMVSIAKKVVEEMHLDNVEVLCNTGMTLAQSVANIGGKHDVVYLLEVIEHCGEIDRPYPSRLEMLQELSKLSDNIVLSVPVMVGIPFLLQRIGFEILNVDSEELSLKDLLTVGLFYNTDEVEKRWDHGHVGFDHRKLENVMDGPFEIVKKRSGFFQNVYHIKAIP
ncbi:class I SAM-dependent methyltransferase [Methanomassiliicoccus luminyensis]|uniref:class I SAM-dependent methyltransferase n=1 Tax=Methanomassiliicoccus luminyensis TaxID=1080712 RepID=UPI00037AA8F3|nr:class I SAM-dependent methyltransferase [Methanomassiliicoccus luminyensis]